MAAVPSMEVQQLVAAEKRATEKVSEARNRKAQRLKKAKEEAAEVIEGFKTEKQISFHQYETDHIVSTDDEGKKIEREANDKLKLLDDRMIKTKEVILDQLIGQVVTRVNAKLHRNKSPMVSGA